MMDVLDAARLSAREGRVVDVGAAADAARPIRGGPMSFPLEPWRCGRCSPTASCPSRRRGAPRAGGLPDTPARRRPGPAPAALVLHRQRHVARSRPDRGGRGAADGGILLRIGIADVDALVPKGSAIDAHAFANSTSVYTGVSVYPMLPEELSTDLTSLIEGEDRLVVVIELEIAADGTVRRHDVYRALATNHAKLDYEASVRGSRDADRSPTRSSPTTRSRRSSGCRIAPRACSSACGSRPARSSSRRSRRRRWRRTASSNRCRDAEESRARSDRGLHDRRERRHRALPRRGWPVGDPARRARAAAVGPHRRDRARRTASTCRRRPTARPCPTSSARRAADPPRFPDLSLSIVKLLGPGEYVLDGPARATTSATSAWRRRTTRTPPRPTAATPIW